MASSLYFIISGITLLTTLAAHGKTGLLYSTAFENFNVGPDLWNGQDGWFSNSYAQTGGIQGIDNEIMEGLGKSSFLGFHQPTVGWNYLTQQINHDPVGEGTATIEIDTLIGLEDSTNQKYDSFFVTLYNTQGDFLAAIQFSNERESFGIFYDDGVTVRDTTVQFLHGELSLLAISIDFQNNLWSADFDGIPLFESIQFTASGSARDLGTFAYEWIVTDPDPAMAGNNWLLVADCSIWAIPFGAPTVGTSIPSFNGEGFPTLQFSGEIGWTYQIEYTNSLGQWLSDLPNSTFVATQPGQLINFTDEDPHRPKMRYYRVRRLVTP